MAFCLHFDEFSEADWARGDNGILNVHHGRSHYRGAPLPRYRQHGFRDNQVKAVTLKLVLLL